MVWLSFESPLFLEGLYTTHNKYLTRSTCCGNILIFFLCWISIKGCRVLVLVCIVLSCCHSTKFCSFVLMCQKGTKVCQDSGLVVLSCRSSCLCCNLCCQRFVLVCTGCFLHRVYPKYCDSYKYGSLLCKLNEAILHLEKILYY